MEEARFWSRVDKSDGCWEWTGPRLPKGYGKAGPRTYAHRLAYELTYGPIPAGLYVLHRCDNPPCVRPEHLFLGTAGDNARDKTAKGRHPREAGRGERHHSAKLTEADVRAIRALLAAGESPQTIAQRFGVTRPAVRFIALRQTWRHVA